MSQPVSLFSPFPPNEIRTKTSESTLSPCYTRTRGSDALQPARRFPQSPRPHRTQFHSRSQNFCVTKFRRIPATNRKQVSYLPPQKQHAPQVLRHPAPGPALHSRRPLPRLLRHPTHPSSPQPPENTNLPASTEIACPLELCVTIASPPIPVRKKFCVTRPPPTARKHKQKRVLSTSKKSPPPPDFASPPLCALTHPSYTARMIY
jgi:hypothetical protein